MYRAFKTDEHADGDEHNLVSRLRKSNAYIKELSLVAELDEKIVGHIMTSELYIKDNGKEVLSSIKIKETERLREIYSHKKATKTVDVGGERKHIAESIYVKETQAGRLIDITNRQLKDLIDELGILGIGSASEIAK